ncbi:MULTISPECIES: efflux transporter outer membrane subunit [unclassified Lentimonas]|uniref:efflux transporter outer membrane subunit n=1 Tax=unclassified Lentimonas TaxID=2630993 RepID=UPI00132326B8|nr:MULTISPECIES: efflux transporter outer membrane subunit [unclassified Lentimonas]CAA6695454.1 RND efflux system, outer membrane lipoprotein CmeC [Lentimonas sp. CC10]CAA6696626.1 RND efflux system, outer membrane lipoprotein CmeC [Lentimonas sp. CC19]CAA7071294.1 RND efflux system, outer membrane lipoprotein CmeC [Lentimonas sp. CC11]
MRPISKFRGIVSLSPLLVLVGCYTAPQREAVELQTLPGQYSSTTKNTAVAPDAVWWTSFNRDDLDALEATAFTDNLDIAQAWARLRQSEAAAKQAGADLYPDLSVTSGYDRTWLNEGDTASNNYEVGAAMSYEVDLWGKIRSTQSAAEARALATADDLKSTALTISASVASRWIEIIEAENRVALLQQQLETNLTQLELIELRFRNSQSNSLDVYQARQTVARTRSSIPKAEAELFASVYALNLLLGKAATEPQEINWQHAPELPPMPSTGVPSDLLQQRPDVRASLRRIEAADWNVAAAKADRLPSVTLGLSGSTGADRFEDLFDDWLARFAGQIVAPVLDGGRRKLEVEKQQAVVDEALAGYRQTVLTALKEVEDALMLEDKVADQLEALRNELALARQTLSAARNRYANGLSDYLNVTSSLISVQSLERDEITQIANLFKARIALHKALGGQLPEFSL